MSPPSRSVTAESSLPSGEAGGRGLSLSPDIPGTQTFAKPVDDVREEPNRDESIFRVRHPGDAAKQQDSTPSDKNDRNPGDTPGSYGTGPKDQNDYSKTKYPYRNDRKDWHNASVGVVVQLFRLSFAPVLRVGPASRVARTLGQILEGLDSGIASRSTDVSVELKRFDAKNLRWILDVTGSKTYAVKVKAVKPRANTTDFQKCDLELSCTCPAWQWRGPAFHAKSEGYQLGKAPGTASTPDVRDPERDNFVCKHVAAVLEVAKNWTLPSSKRRKKK